MEKLLEQWQVIVDEGENISLPITEGTPKATEYGKVLAYKDVISAIERSQRGDFSFEKAKEIILDLANNCGNEADERARAEVYLSCLESLKSVEKQYDTKYC